SGRMSMLIVASLLIAASALTKYFGVTLIPLLAAYGFARSRRIGAWMLPLLIPFAVLAAYHVATRHLYGRSLLFDAAGYAAERRWAGESPVVATIVKGLSFTGGCCASIVLLTMAALPMRTLMWTALGATAAFAALTFDPIGAALVRAGGGARLLVQLAPWAGAGAAMLVMLGRRLWSARDAEALLLALWIGGTFCFSVFVNWNVAARSILPLTPAAAIVAAGFYNSRGAGTISSRLQRRAWAGIAVSGILALLIAAADTSLARSQRQGATELAGLRERTKQLWFAGHWGFQHYIRGAARPLDAAQIDLAPGDIVIYPENNTAIIELPPGTVRRIELREYDVMPLVSTMLRGQAGFYSDVWGPLPFAFGPVPRENYHIVVVEVPVVDPPR
ncbi:MAG: hypothetical protein QOF78_2001, partial [Phycisphaerales bacterium]|nr:hypothetical protein [Phycisphaerales bacterium]